MSTVPVKLQEIVEDFAGMTREEKIETLIAYADSLPPLPDWLKEEREKMEPVPECMTPVFLFGEKQPDGGLIFHFDIPRESPTVRGLAAILATGLNGSQPEEILSVPADFYLPMKLEDAISQQRLRGFNGVLAHMRQSAVKALNDK
jgi:cysteine desulfuration protein SufE